MHANEADARTPNAVKIWLLTGLVMVFFQIFIGGVTRLTGSGLSITKWEVVRGTIPPMSETAWQAEFELYKQTPQYHKINQGMSLDAFKFIYFWEYFHRLWARLMFFVFVIPFAWFYLKKMFSKRLVPRLLVVVGLAGLEGFFGWIMVASGLIQRPWVNAYNLTLHLSMGVLIFGYLLWTTFIAFDPAPRRWATARQERFGWILTAFAFLQIILGAMMSGTKAGLFFPSWPLMNGAYLPGIVLDGAQWNADSFIHYDTNAFLPALIQFLHRNTAYLLVVLGGYFVWRNRGADYAWGRWSLAGILMVQVLLGIFTVLDCVGKIPVGLGVAHQAGAVFLFTALLLVNYQTQRAVSAV